MDIYEEMRKQKAKIYRVQEMIRIAKIQSKMRDETFKGYNI
jgi:hypothetical protein